MPLEIIVLYHWQIAKEFEKTFPKYLQKQAKWCKCGPKFCLYQNTYILRTAFNSKVTYAHMSKCKLWYPGPWDGDILDQGLIELIKYSCQQGESSFSEAYLERTSKLSVLGLEQFGMGDWSKSFLRCAWVRTKCAQKTRVGLWGRYKIQRVARSKYSTSQLSYIHMWNMYIIKHHN
jgi:hypothetical protein